MSTVLIVVAHPDDEILGVGGTAIKHIQRGDEVYALVLGEGQTSRWDEKGRADVSAVELLHKDSYKASKIIGFKDIFFEMFPDNRFDQIDILDIVKVIEKYIKKISPKIIYTHHGGDLNVDHRITNQAVLTATRPIGTYSVKEIYGFETVSSTEWFFSSRDNTFMPQKFVDVSGVFEQKCDAMRAYTSELCEFPHPRSLKTLAALAEVRGSTVGMQKAEAFEVIRIIGEI